MSVPGKFLNQENIIKKVFDETTNSLRTSASGGTGGNATVAEQQTQTVLLQQIANNTDGIEGNQTTQTTVLDNISKKAVLNTAAVSTLINTSITPIPTVGALTVFPSTSSAFYSFQTIDDIGEYMALCTGAAGSEVIVAALPLGGGDVDVLVPVGSRLSIKSLNGSNVTSGKIIINAKALGQP